MTSHFLLLSLLILRQYNQSLYGYIAMRSDKHRTVANFIIRQADIHFSSASKDSFSTGLDTVLLDLSFSNVFCFSTTTGSKSLESRLIDTGYDVSLGHVN